MSCGIDLKKNRCVEDGFVQGDFAKEMIEIVYFQWFRKNRTKRNAIIEK